jgi:hypothetical protein
MSLIIRQTQWTVMPEGESIFTEGTTVITIQDEAAGEYLEVEQLNGQGKLYIEPDNWPAIRKAIDEAVAACGQYADKPAEPANPEQPSTH